MKKHVYLLFFLAAFLLLMAACSNEESKKDSEETSNTNETSEQKDIAFEPPNLEDLEGKDDPFSQSVKKGHELFQSTDGMLPENVGNKLSCASCHATGGLDDSGSLVGVTAVFPEYNPRAGKVLTIEDRINGCFVRSMNGKPLESGSEELTAMVSYLTYISKDVPTLAAERPWIEKNKMEKLPEPNASNGEKLYQQSCIQCHGQNGEGTGATTGPALWGENSFNIGAGMARMKTAAGYIQRNMPKGAMGGINEGELTDQQAADLAAYILSHERPDFKGKEKDWPNGDAPDDAAYETTAKKTAPATSQNGEGGKKE
ncbi:thiosulfate dehydrogenase [Bacillus ectoiniformans]|nr:c-type cytochrome [Bacillus ectoiniformans]MBM7649784.1 thiosulfate dehydrogenase [Bacillus ectoiniformans]